MERAGSAQGQNGGLCGWSKERQKVDQSPTTCAGESGLPTESKGG